MTAVPLTLYVDAAAWHNSLRALINDEPSLVPVIKGNGYGFTVPVLARTAAALGVERIAVGTAEDAAAVLGDFPGEVFVLEGPPRMGATATAADPGRVVYTAASVPDAAALAESGLRFVVDCRSTLQRQGVAVHELDGLRQAVAGGTVEGYSLHLPIDRPPGADPVVETARWVDTLRRAGLDVPVMYVSHLSGSETAGLARAYPDTAFRVRAGTRLWLGHPCATSAAATVTQAVQVRHGERVGYRQLRAAHDAWLVVVNGGTAHGVGLEAPKALRGLAARARALARSGLAAANLVRSPFSWQNRKLWFAEPPHMLVSMLFLRGDVEPPWPGAELPAELRLTATTFDRVVAY